MKAIIIEISSYLMVAISLGYFFGWIITRALIKTRFEQQITAFKKQYHYAAEGIDKIQQALAQSKSSNSDLHSQNNKILLENSQKKLKLHQMGVKFKALKKLNANQESNIKKLNVQLSDKENSLIRLTKEYEAKVKALRYEEKELNEKYQVSQKEQNDS